MPGERVDVATDERLEMGSRADHCDARSIFLASRSR
jgi:hypothetical protein